MTPGSTAAAEPTSTTAAEPTDELDCEQTCAETGAATDTGSEPDVDWVRTGLIGLGGAVAVLVAVVVFRKMRNRKASGEHDGEDL